MRMVGGGAGVLWGGGGERARTNMFVMNVPLNKLKHFSIIIIKNKNIIIPNTKIDKTIWI